MTGDLAVSLQRGCELGLHRAAQVEVIGGPHPLSMVVGRNASGDEATSTTQFPWTCATKLLGVFATAALVSDGVLDIEAPLCEHVTDLRGTSLGQRTVADLLTHQTGLGIDAGDEEPIVGRARVLADLVADADRDEVASRPPDGWAPSYRVWSHWFLLSEVVASMAGRPFDEFVTTRLLGPLGLDRVALRPSAVDAVDRVLFEVGQGNEVTTVKYDQPPYDDHCLTAYSAHGPAAALARLLSLLYDEGASAAVGIAPEVLADVTRPRRCGRFDDALGWDPTWGLGLLLDTRAWPGYPATLLAGHFGLGASLIAFADLDRRLAAVAVFGRAPKSLPATARSLMVLRAVADHVRS